MKMQKDSRAAFLSYVLKPLCVIADPQQITVIHIAMLVAGKRIKPGALRVPERSSSCVSCIAGLCLSEAF